MSESRTDDIIEILGNGTCAYNGGRPAKNKRRTLILAAAIVGVQAIMLGVVLVSVVFAAYAFPRRLYAPENLRVVDNVLIWNEVEGADGYVVNINGQEFTVTANSHSLSGLSGDGEYLIRVRAVTDERRGGEIPTSPYRLRGRRSRRAKRR